VQSLLTKWHSGRYVFGINLIRRFGRRRSVKSHPSHRAEELEVRRIFRAGSTNWEEIPEGSAVVAVVEEDFCTFVALFDCKTNSSHACSV